MTASEDPRASSAPQKPGSEGGAEGEPLNWRERPSIGAEQRTVRERRLRIRCWRRGTKEMDLILGGFFDDAGARLSDADLDAFEALIREDDGVLYRWIAEQEPPPKEHAAIVSIIRENRFAG